MRGPRKSSSGMHKYTNIFMAAALMSVGGQITHARCSDGLVKAIVDEHNRYRTKPGEVAKELADMKETLVAGRVRGGEPRELAEAAVVSAIQDLDALKPLTVLTCSEGGTEVAQAAADRLGATRAHSIIADLVVAWKAANGPGVPSAESVTSLGTEATDAARAQRIVRDLFIDWGAGNAGIYLHRQFIEDYQSVSTTKPSVNRGPGAFRYVGVGINRGAVYVQYGR